MIGPKNNGYGSQTSSMQKHIYNYEKFLIISHSKIRNLLKFHDVPYVLRNASHNNLKRVNLQLIPVCNFRYTE